jgi:hypothetical protein
VHAAVERHHAGPLRGHRHFSTVGNFDKHRRGRDDDRQCVDPATLFDANGAPRMREVVTKYGSTWVLNDAQDQFRARRKLTP